MSRSLSTEEAAAASEARKARRAARKRTRRAAYERWEDEYGRALHADWERAQYRDRVLKAHGEEAYLAMLGRSGADKEAPPPLDEDPPPSTTDGARAAPCAHPGCDAIPPVIASSLRTGNPSRFRYCDAHKQQSPPRMPARVTAPEGRHARAGVRRRAA